MLLGALAPVIPERVIAACSGTMNLLNIGGIDLRNGIYYNFVETYAGGQGAMFDSDGMDAVQNHMTNTRNAPVEAIDLAYPLLRRVLRIGAGQRGRGSPPRRARAYSAACGCLGESATLTLSSDRERIGPWGLFGGQDASPSACSVRPPQNGPQPSGEHGGHAAAVQDNHVGAQGPHHRHANAGRRRLGRPQDTGPSEGGARRSGGDTSLRRGRVRCTRWWWTSGRGRVGRGGDGGVARGTIHEGHEGREGGVRGIGLWGGGFRLRIEPKH